MVHQKSLQQGITLHDLFLCSKCFYSFEEKIEPQKKNLKLNLFLQRLGNSKSNYN